jgi:hypothetical protein
MFEYIALRFDSMLLDLELMEKSQVIFADPLLLFFFDFAEPCISCMLASF